jgi:hypothetical protein
LFKVEFRLRRDNKFSGHGDCESYA